MTTREIVLEVLRTLPEDVTLEEVSEEIAVLAAIKRAEQVAGDGRLISHEEVRCRSELWTQT